MHLKDIYDRIIGTWKAVKRRTAVMTKKISIFVYCESDGMTDEVSVMETEEYPLVNGLYDINNLTIIRLTQYITYYFTYNLVIILCIRLGD